MNKRELTPKEKHTWEHLDRRWMKILKRQPKQEKEMRDKGIWTFYKPASRLPA